MAENSVAPCAVEDQGAIEPGNKASANARDLRALRRILTLLVDDMRFPRTSPGCLDLGVRRLF